MVFNATFNNISDVFVSINFINGGNRIVPRKKVTDKLYHIMNEIQAQRIRH